MHLRRIIFTSLLGLLNWNPIAAQQLPDINTSAETSGVSADGERVVNTAMQYIGVRYRMGANGPKSFDCSGFTRFVYSQKNIALTRCSKTQYNEGTPVEKIADLQPGDLVFFSGSRRSGVVEHVGIVKSLNADSSNFTFVHASRTGVKVDELSCAYYKTRYLGARRVL